MKYEENTLADHWHLLKRSPKFWWPLCKSESSSESEVATFRVMMSNQSTIHIQSNQSASYILWFFFKYHFIPTARCFRNMWAWRTRGWTPNDVLVCWIRWLSPNESHRYCVWRTAQADLRWSQYDTGYGMPLGQAAFSFHMFPFESCRRCWTFLPGRCLHLSKITIPPLVPDEDLWPKPWSFITASVARFFASDLLYRSQSCAARECPMSNDIPWNRGTPQSPGWLLVPVL